MIPTLFLAAFADDGLTHGTERQQLAIERCLANWGEHPFGEKPRFKEGSLEVRVLQRHDYQKVDDPTDVPQLVYIEPNVNVLSRVTYQLTNPNGWYCFNNHVDVLSKIRFELQCDAKLTVSREGATVLGADEVDKGVTVLGSVRIERRCAADATGVTDAPGAPAPASSLPASDEVEKPKYFYPAKK